MKIVISGYGRMGKLIHQTALKKNHLISAILDNDKDWKQYENEIRLADMVIDFSVPDAVMGVIKRCFGYNIPLVTGTTGWYNKLNDIKDECIKTKQSLLYAPNFSIGMNILFAINKYLSQLMNEATQYDVSIQEAHHKNKLDAPSGTAIKIATDIIGNINRKNKWVNNESHNKEELEIFSERKDNIIGVHQVIYTSNEDEIIIEHQAKNRDGLALGAIIAAEWLLGKTGFYTMEDIFKYK